MIVGGIARGPLQRATHVLPGFRFNSSSAAVRDRVVAQDVATLNKPAGPLSRLPTKNLVRALVLTSLMSRKWLLRPSLALIGLMSRSQAAILSPDRNPFLNKLMRWTLYNHFAAGTSREEVAKTSAEIKAMGCGVILGYAKEVVLQDPTGAADKDKNKTDYLACHYEAVEEWKQGTLKTLRMIGPGDFLYVKLTGGGPIALDAMKTRASMPQVIEDAMDEICRETKDQGSRLWVDAEQQALQPAVDDWTIQLMRKYNRNGEALLYNTIQAYLKGSRANAIRHIQLAAEEGWTVAIKLCRGAYIEHEVRALIHDTKAETDQNYDLIASCFVSQTMPPELAHLKFPPSALFLATHNAASAEKAVSTYCSRGAAGLPVTQALNCGQIQGMADELSCQLVQAHEESLTSGAGRGFQAPGVFKCLSWGSVTECLGYLHRRAVENGGAVERTQHMAAVYKKELYRRIGF